MQIHSAIPEIFDSQTSKQNKCVSRLARRKSHHTALHDAAATSSDCPTEPRPIPTAQRASPQIFFPRCDLYVGIFSPGAMCIYIIAHPGSNAAAVTPHEPKFTKMEKLIPDSSRTSMQSFIPLSFSAAEKSVTIHTNKQTYSRLSIPHTTLQWDKKSQRVLKTEPYAVYYMR